MRLVVVIHRFSTFFFLLFPVPFSYVLNVNYKTVALRLRHYHETDGS